MSVKRKVLIVGAGLAGLALYQALDKRMFTVEIIEKRENLKRLGFALIFMPHGVKALRELGYSSADIRRLGEYSYENQIRNKDGKITEVTDYRPIFKKFDAFLLVSRRKLYNLLERNLPEKELSFGVEPRSFRQLKDVVVVGFAGGKKKEYDIVIGADGVHSTVREAIFPDSKPKDTGLTFIWAWIPRDAAAFPRQIGLMGDETVGIGLFDSGDRSQVCVFFYLRNDKLPQQVSSADYQRLWRQHLKDFKSPLPEILDNLPPGAEMHMHRDHELVMDKWHKGNIILVGDAAHARSVFSGAGSGLALEDAVLLGKYLSAEIEINKAVEMFEKAQKSRVHKLTLERLFSLNFEKTITDFISSSSLFKKDL